MTVPLLALLALVWTGCTSEMTVDPSTKAALEADAGVEASVCGSVACTDDAVFCVGCECAGQVCGWFSRDMDEGILGVCSEDLACPVNCPSVLCREIGF